MKKNIFKLATFLFFLLLLANGCTKPEDDKPDNAKKVSTGKQIASFKIVTPAATGIIDTVNKMINITVPNGTSFVNLATDISLASGYSITPASGVAQNFTSPVVYTVKAPDNTTTPWTVTVSTSGVIVDHDITASVTWLEGKTYFIQGDIYVDNNAVLTIQPGTVIKFGASASLSFGSSSNATLIANGTAQKPIIFTSDAPAPAPGAWEGIYFLSHTLNNTSMSYCQISFAGSNSTFGALNANGVDISVDHCSITNSASYGVWTYYANNYGGFSTFTNNTISSTAKYGIYIHAQKVGAIGTGNVITNTPGVLINGDFKSSTATTWRNLGVPYIVDSEMDIDGTLTIEPGTAFKFESAGWMAIGYYNATTFTAEGTAQAPITFTSNSSSPIAGAWRGFNIYDNIQTNSKFKYCIIDYAGSNSSNGAFKMSGTSSVNFSYNIIRNSSSYGIVCDADAGFETFENNTISNCANHLISLGFRHIQDLGIANAMTPAANKGILVTGDARYSEDVIWRKQPADYYVTGGETDIDGNVTIEAGTKFLFVNDSFFYFGYYANTKLTAVGTATARITFTTSASSPAPGAWRGIYFDGFTQTNTSLAYCNFLYTGLNNKPAIYTEKAILVSYTSITNYSSPHAAEVKTGIIMLAGLGNDFTWVAN
jgi:hypothetical protein